MTRWFIASALLLCTSDFMYAQPHTEDGSIHGFIVSEINNSPIPFANIWLPKVKKGAVADEKGYFYITGLADDTYSLTISFIGYKTITMKDLTLTKGQSLNLANIYLEEDVITLNVLFR